MLQMNNDFPGLSGLHISPAFTSLKVQNVLKISWLGIQVLIQVVTGYQAEKLMGWFALCSSEQGGAGSPSSSSSPLLLQDCHPPLAYNPLNFIFEDHKFYMALLLLGWLLVRL